MEPTKPERLTIPLILAAGAVIAALAFAASVWPEAPAAALLFTKPFVFASVAALAVAAVLEFVQRRRPRGAFRPRWFVAITYLKVAALPAVVALAVLAVATWLFGWPHWWRFMRAAFLLVAAVGLLTIWSLLAFHLHSLLRRASTPPAPPPASR